MIQCIIFTKTCEDFQMIGAFCPLLFSRFIYQTNAPNPDQARQVRTKALPTRNQMPFFAFFAIFVRCPFSYFLNLIMIV